MRLPRLQNVSMLNITAQRVDGASGYAPWSQKGLDRAQMDKPFISGTRIALHEVKQAQRAQSQAEKPPPRSRGRRAPRLLFEYNYSKQAKGWF